jgi:hypothetical protein
LRHYSRLVHETAPAKALDPPWYQAWLKILAQKNKHSSPARDERNEEREQKLSDRQLERYRIMGGAFHDREVSEKVALSGSTILHVGQGDVLFGWSRRYLHPSLFKKIC